MQTIADELNEDATIAMSFLRDCPAPTPGQVAAWQARHPAHAQGIAAWARLALGNPEEDPAEEGPELDAMAARVLGAGMARLDARGG